MATNNALSNYMEEAFLTQFVAPTKGTIYVAVPFTGNIGVGSIEEGLLVEGSQFTHVVNSSTSLDPATVLNVQARSLANYNGSANILSSDSVTAGCFKIVPIFFSFPVDATNTIQNTYQLDFGVLGDSAGGSYTGAGVSLTGYYVYAGEIRELDGDVVGDLVDISLFTGPEGEITRTAITDGTATDYTITVNLSKPAFYGTLSKVQTINTGIDILIKKNDIKFSMD